MMNNMATLANPHPMPAIIIPTTYCPGAPAEGLRAIDFSRQWGGHTQPKGFYQYCLPFCSWLSLIASSYIYI